MSQEKQQTAFVYIDGQNVRGSARDYFGQKDLNNVNLARIVESIVRGERDISLQTIRYYSGVRPESMPKKRAEDIVLLDRLASLGIKTFGNDLVPDAVGRLGENGIDMKISCDMVLDFLKNPNAKSFIVLSNDTDFHPTFEMLKDVARQLKRDVDCAVIVTGNKNGAMGARKIELSPGLYKRHCSVGETVTAEAQERLLRDPESALDLSRHGAQPKSLRTETEVTLTGKTGCYVDANTLGSTAKECFNRKYLDTNVGKLLVHIGAERGRPPAFAKMFLSTHDPKFSLVDSLLTREISAAAGRQNFSVISEPFQYKRPVVARDSTGAGSSVAIHALMPVEKRIETKILHAVVMDMLRRQVDDVVIVSDRRSLWPMAEVVGELGKALGVQRTATNVHFVEPGIEGMKSVPVTRGLYETFVHSRDMLSEARVEAESMVVAERDQMAKALKNKYPAAAIVLDPEEITGVVVLEGAHSWSAVDDGNGTIGVVFQLPMRPDPGVRYTVSRGAMRRSDSQDIERLDNLQRAQHLSSTTPEMMPKARSEAVSLHR